VSVITSVAITVIGIGFLILAHEFGHFIVAKLSNVKVERFSIGFGPEIAGFTRGETRYRLGLLPIGGYVKMMGDEPGSEEAAAERSFLGQRYFNKLAIVVAGSAMNIILSLVLFIGLFRVGIELPAPKVGGLVQGYPASYSGLERGDVIRSVNGRDAVDFTDLKIAVALTTPGRPVHLVVERAGESFAETLYPIAGGEGIATVGIVPYATLEVEGFLDVSPGEEGIENDGKVIKSPARAAGLGPGWVITAFNGRPVETWYDLEDRLYENGLSPYSLTAVKGGRERTFEITPARDPAATLGVSLTSLVVDKVEEGSLADEMGLEAGDKIVGLGETEINGPMHLQYLLARHMEAPRALRVVAKDGSRTLDWPRPPESPHEIFDGLTLKADTTVMAVIPGSPAERLGIMPGDVITAVDGEQVATLEGLRRRLRQSTQRAIEVSWERDGRRFAGSFEPVLIDIVPRIEEWMHKLGLADSCRVGVKKAWDFASQVYIIIKRALGGDTGILKSLGGPVTIARASYEIASRKSPSEFLLWLAIISVNLAVVNLLPIPLLDGGHLVIFTVEKLKGSPLSPKTQIAIQYVGLVLILALFIFVTYQDILRIFR